MEQKLRAVLFYLCAISFFILLPLVLLYSFGYKIDFSRFRVAKAGLIYIKTVPEGARVYLNGRALKEKTPVTLEGILPGEYKVSLDFKAYYLWEKTVSVTPGNTTSLDNIILFPRKPYFDKLSISDIGNFYVFPADRDYAYCISEDRSSIYKVRLNAQDPDAVLLCDNLDLPSNSRDFALSPDKKKALSFYDNRLDVIYLPAENLDCLQAKANNFFVISDDRIQYAFWYSDSGRIIIVSERSIKIYDLLSQGKSNIIAVITLRDSHCKALYDTTNDNLYFTDIQKGADNKWHRGLYRLDLGSKTPLSFIRNIEGNLQ